MVGEKLIFGTCYECYKGIMDFDELVVFEELPYHDYCLGENMKNRAQARRDKKIDDAIKRQASERQGRKN